MVIPLQAESEDPLLPAGAEVALLVALVLAVLALLLALLWWVVRRSRR